MKLLDGLAIVTMALNLPGPVACARLRGLGARVIKVEPPGGDPLAGFVPGWYARLHTGMDVRRIDLKTEAGIGALHGLLGDADLFVTAQRPAALARLGLDAATLAARHPRLCALAITGHAPPHDDAAGHDLTYLAMHGLVDPPRLPPTLFADMAGAERVVSTALALVHARDRDGRGASGSVPLAEAAAHLAQPLAEGLTRPGAPLGGGLAAYNLYLARTGWIAVAALEPHFARRLAEALGLASLTAEALAERFARESAQHWEDWARELDLPIVAVRTTSTPNP
jgi:crotonobetainyl-CoA:carnitine CoA-transferase CaiB-like acyl-CoA transferase